MDIFEMVGGFGPWQQKVFMIFLFLNIVGMWQNFSIIFLAPNMDFHCVQPPRILNNESVTNLTFDFDVHCEVPLGHNQSTLVPCTQWEYDLSETSQTIVSEWDLVCSREWLVSLTKSIYMIGFLLSVIVFGQLSDCIGRHPTIVICYIINLVSMFLSLLSTSFTMFLILRFSQSFGRAGLTTVGFVLLLEIVGPKYQTKVGIGTQLGWAVGFVTLPGIVWFFRHWFWIQLIISVSFVPFAFTYSIVPESPRWLLLRGKMQKLEDLLTKAAATNGLELKEGLRNIELVKSKMENKEKKPPTIIEVLKMPKMRNRSFYMAFLWMVNAFLYYGLSYNTNDLAGNPYLNFFIAGALEFPSYAFLYWSINYWGRRPTLVALMLVSAATCAAILPVPPELPWLATSFAMVGKFCVSGSFGLMYLYTTEVFPTGVRNVTLGSCSMCARIGSILAPFVRDLGKATHSAVPNVLYSLLALTSGLLALLLPETRGLDLPDTLQEGEDLGQ